MVRDAHSKTDPSKGGEDNLAVLDMHPLLAIQAEGPHVTVNERSNWACCCGSLDAMA